MQPDDVSTGFDYLARRGVLIINLSYIYTGSVPPFFADSMTNTLRGKDMLLIVPAGDDTTDLDAQPLCPPCLGAPTWEKYEALVGRRTLVIGAATKSLHPAAYSGTGERTVTLYAPGESIGAVDILGKDASNLSPATSFAAPYVAFAAALMKSLGMSDIAQIANRIRAASWPLLIDGSDAASYAANVLDITKAAAVRNYAVEVLEPNATGQMIRRTYVGQLDQKLDEIPICAGTQFKEDSVQAVRMGPPDTSGNRHVTTYSRFPKPVPTKSYLHGCQPSGMLKLTALGHGDVQFPLSSVTQILVPWIISSRAGS